MLNTNDFGWNDVRKCVEVDSEEVWKSYVESHKEASNWRNKSFLYYERLANIFRKDCTTRRSAETPIDMANATLQEEIYDDNNEINDEGSPMFATPTANSQYTTRSHAQSSHRKWSKSDDYIAFGIEKLVSAFHQANTDMSQSMYGSSEDRDYIAKQLVSMRLSVDDELMALNLMVEKPSNIRAFNALRNDRDRKLAYARMHLLEH